MQKEYRLNVLCVRYTGGKYYFILDSASWKKFSQLANYHITSISSNALIAQSRLTYLETLEHSMLDDAAAKCILMPSIMIFAHL